MRGQGHQIFAEKLRRFAADAANPRVAAIAQRVGAPLRIAVSGRRGVGRATVARALAAAGFAVTAQDSSEVVVYVIAEVLKPEDQVALAAARRPVLALLNKADVAGLRSGAGPLVFARNRCAQFSALTGVPMEPLVGLLADAVLNNLLDGVLCEALSTLAAHRFDDGSPGVVAAARGVLPAATWRHLLDTLDVFGVAVAIAAIQQGRPAAEIPALLLGVSNADAVVDRLTALGSEACYLRVCDAVTELEALAVTDPNVGEFLCCDDTVIARMDAAADVLDAAGMGVERCDGRAAYLARAVRWTQYSRRRVSPVQRACSADLARGSLRLWARTGGSVSIAARSGASP
ncbi:hypothetical protein [Mycobacterium botniense]|uniref:Uncharacterized protein n=1 Tax=Mycobacterium botniense TaxID=84962 RepID=A0A7I9XVX5_9MYCO|nr:hypothetical protein [Mycobacterium botniense]GFG73935.1 hypothetical protein MBOT_13000 [Mycobacterium botniense]